MRAARTDQKSFAGDAKKAAVFHAALRHSRMVKILRLVLPLFAVATMGLYFLSSKMSIAIGPGVASIDAINLDGGAIRMENPNYTGFDEKNGNYVVRAEYALQDIKKPRIFNLHNIEAKTNDAQKGWVRMVAAQGLFDAEKEFLTLTNSINITNHSGMKAVLQDAVVNMKTRNIETKRPVVVEMPGGQMRSERLSIDTATQFLHFQDKVQVHLKNQPQNNAEEPAKDGMATMFKGTKEPLDISSDTLEIHNKQQKAIFKGQVTTVQGQMQMTALTLQINYKQSSGQNALQNAHAQAEQTESSDQNGGPQIQEQNAAQKQAQQISQIRAQDNVVIATADGRRAEANWSLFDNDNQLVTLGDAVTVSQDKNLLTGGRLVINMKTRHSQFPPGFGRVKGHFQPKEQPDAKKKKDTEEKQSQPEAQKDGPLDTNLMNFSSMQSGNDPISIEADQLDLHDLKQKATFSGNVVVNQAKNIIRSETMDIEYNGQAGAMSSATTQTGAQAGQIKHIIARGKVFIKTPQNQTVSGDKAIFNVYKDEAVIEGNVVASSGGDVIKGHKIVMDLKTGQTRVIPGETAGSNGGTQGGEQQGSNGRVRLMFTPKDHKKLDNKKSE